MIIEQPPILSLALQDLRDSSAIAIVDLSSYVTIPTSGQYALQITPPGYETTNVTFTPGTVNIYHCADLGVTCNPQGCTPLPDGIYEVVYSVHSLSNGIISIDQKFIKIDTIKCKFQHAFLQVDLNCGCQDQMYWKYMNELRSIKMYIDGSVAICNTGNYRLSFEYYNKALKMLDKLKTKFPNSKWKICNC